MMPFISDVTDVIIKQLLRAAATTLLFSRLRNVDEKEEKRAQRYLNKELKKKNTSSIFIFFYSMVMSCGRRLTDRACNMQ